MGLICWTHTCFVLRPRQQTKWVKMPCGRQECGAGSRGAGRLKRHSQGNCNPVKNPAVSDVKLI